MENKKETNAKERGDPAKGDSGVGTRGQKHTSAHKKQNNLRKRMCKKAEGFIKICLTSSGLWKCVRRFSAIIPWGGESASVELLMGADGCCRLLFAHSPPQI